MAFKMKGPTFFNVGKTTSLKHRVNDNPEHRKDYGEHSDDLQTEEEHKKGEIVEDRKSAPSETPMNNYDIKKGSHSHPHKQVSAASQRKMNLLKSYDKNKDNESYKNALNKEMGGKTSYNSNTNVSTTEKPIAMKGFPYSGKSPVKQRYETNSKTGEIRENVEKGFIILKKGTDSVPRTRKNKADWKASDKDGKPFKQKKTSGFGPRAAKGDDDQSKELAKSRYEMGQYKADPTKNSKKVMKDGLPNKTTGAGNTGNWQAYQFRK